MREFLREQVPGYARSRIVTFSAQIGQLDRETGRVLVRTHEHEGAFRPTASPDGRWLVFLDEGQIETWELPETGPAKAGITIKPSVLLVFGKQQVCETLSVDHYARVHGLTHAEGMVLAALCDGDTPAEVAERFGVAVSTVRSQISAIRQKTRCNSIRELVRRVAVLPPIVPALGRMTSTGLPH